MLWVEMRLWIELLMRKVMERMGRCMCMKWQRALVVLDHTLGRR